MCRMNKIIGEKNIKAFISTFIQTIDYLTFWICFTYLTKLLTLQVILYYIKTMWERLF